MRWMKKIAMNCMLTDEFSRFVWSLIHKEFECFTQWIHIFVVVIEARAYNIVEFIFEIQQILNHILIFLRIDDNRTASFLLIKPITTWIKKPNCKRSNIPHFYIMITLTYALKLMHNSVSPFLTRLNNEYNSFKSSRRFSSSKFSKPLCKMPVKCSDNSCFSTV